MKRINIVCITLLMILLGVNTSCADYLDKAPDEDLTLDDVFTRENYAEQFLSSIYWNMPWELNFTNDWGHNPFVGAADELDYPYTNCFAYFMNNGSWTPDNVLKDITNYYLTVPKSNVEIGFWLESDRMLELAFSEQSLEVQRAVVMEEFKQRCLNQPYGDVGHLLRPLAYQTHPYRWPTIGKDLSHIANATLDEVKEFFFRFYAPNNAVLAVTGNISWEETIRLTEKWFAPIPRRNVPVRQLPQEVVQTAERRQTVERNVPLDALFMAYHMCSREDADYYAFDILSDILSNGRSSRLTRRLVQEQKLFSSLDAYISGTRDAGLLHISGKPSAGVSLEQAEAAVRKELEELKSGFVGEQELEKVKNKFESTQIFGNINYLNVATNLAWFELTGQAEDIDREVDNYRSVTAEQLHRVAQQTFRDENGIVLYYQKENL